MRSGIAAAAAGGSTCRARWSAAARSRCAALQMRCPGDALFKALYRSACCWFGTHAWCAYGSAVACGRCAVLHTPWQGNPSSGSWAALPVQRAIATGARMVVDCTLLAVLWFAGVTSRLIGLGSPCWYSIGGELSLGPLQPPLPGRNPHPVPVAVQPQLSHTRPPPPRAPQPIRVP